MVLLGPGSTVSHDALRLLAHARTGLAAVGQDGVRLYTAPPLMPDRSGLARRQARTWADEQSRLMTARRMYAMRLGEVLPHRSLNVLRGIEGARMKESYRLHAQRIGGDLARSELRSIPAPGRGPAQSSSQPCVERGGGRKPQSPWRQPLPFLNSASFTKTQDSPLFWILQISIATSVTIPTAFRAAKRVGDSPGQNIERVSRRLIPAKFLPVSRSFHQ